jgi:hypothetical protein
MVDKHVEIRVSIVQSSGIGVFQIYSRFKHLIKSF